MIEVDAASPDLVTNASTQNFAATLVLFEDVGRWAWRMNWNHSQKEYWSGDDPGLRCCLGSVGRHPQTPRFESFEVLMSVHSVQDVQNEGMLLGLKDWGFDVRVVTACVFWGHPDGGI